MKEQTKEGNRVQIGNCLIADFVGYVYYPDPAVRQYEEGNHKYHASWDWFMVAYAMFIDKVKTEEIELDHQGSALLDLVEHSLTLANRTSAHEYFVQLIEWYNKEQEVQEGDATAAQSSNKS